MRESESESESWCVWVRESWCVRVRETYNEAVVYRRQGSESLKEGRAGGTKGHGEGGICV